MRVVVAGYGMAGARVVSELRARGADVTAFGAETHRPYNRVMLSTLLAGKVREDDLTLAAPPPGADLRLGVPVTALDLARRVVVTPEGEQAYDALVLATGATAVLPPMDGVPAATAHVLRTLDDCRGILAAAGGARSAVVLGGGLLGLEAARGLAGCGLAVTVVHAGGHVMDRQLDPDGGHVLARTLRDLGVCVRVGARATAWTGDRLLLADGTAVPGDLLVVACGARPDTALARAAGLAVHRGVLVDDGLRTSDPHVYAVGDCAEHDGTVHGLVAPAWEQAAALADRLTGGTARYRGSRLVTRLKAGGIDLAAMGSVAPDPDAEVVTFADPARGTYVRLVIRGDRLAGAVLLGDNPSVGAVTQLYDRDAPVPADRRSLLFGRAFGAEPAAPAASPAFMPDHAVVCRCNSVPKAAITACWRSGARSVADVAAATRATTGCGGCADAVTGIVDWLSTVEPEVTV
ncbi:FAD-dependent oxidoreductase [Spirilliplanes yamanashiensis]|uniref:FAD-dependent oxidoreductase n=1 Tax=Spirilliplanes yamanashiensis TaxID=42233 RepID=UPI0019520D37|nr:FAD-dependent oxidoreductase [Spirilliplanes yamanashiensis]MDP9818071.1 assimilatory nitrate reductase electron transfer subunit [Spirilliplanes yamanashiensis]